ncbi:hypothetical protein DPMN_146122 [Dreissena polymorpha]|uniref:BTB domain-containing protein n=1 Tax=Dreissena polymorpha TaxID=45954 RepID=A0A9D4F5C0_DREPO|nr:hypothetical protein DPMN_146122 [Dreissena polymorpha]
MLENEEFCDVIFAAGNEQKQIKCHKLILASRSPVFYAAFCGTLAESKDVIFVPDIESSTLDNLLRYLYSGNVEINADIVLSLLYTAKKYDIPVLADGLNFIVSDDCELSGIDMFLPCVEGSVTGVLELLERTTVIHTQNVTLHYNKGVEHMLVDLEKRLHLNSRNEYSIRQIMKGSNTFYCVSAKRNITMEGVPMTLSDLKVGQSDNGTTVNSGQFYGF